MNELILLPTPKKPEDDSIDPGEIFIDPDDRRAARSRNARRRPGLLLLAVLAGAAYAFYPAKQAPKPDQTVADQTALIEKTQQQVTALQGEVRELRAKLDAAEKRPVEQPAPPPAAAKADLPPTEAATTTSNAAPAVPGAKEPPVEAAPKAAAPPAARAKAATAETPPVQNVAPTPKAVRGYKLRDVSHGVAILETRRGVIAVRAGDILPDDSRVIAVQKRAGRWVVATDNGDIVGEAQSQARPPAPRRRPIIREQYGYEPRPLLPSLFIPF